MRIIALSGAQSLLHPVFGAVEAGPDGVFDVPAAFGEELVKQRGAFITEGEHLANQVKASLLELSDPHKIPQVLHDLRERIASLEAELAAAKAAPSEVVAEVKKRVGRPPKVKDAAVTDPPVEDSAAPSEAVAEDTPASDPEDANTPDPAVE